MVVFQIIRLKEIGFAEIVTQLFFKDNKFNRGRLEGVAYRDKDGKLRLGYPDQKLVESPKSPEVDKS